LRAFSAQAVQRSALLSKAPLQSGQALFGSTHRRRAARGFSLRCRIAFGSHLRGAFLQRGRVFQSLRAAFILTTHGGTNTGEETAFGSRARARAGATGQQQ